MIFTVWGFYNGNGIIYICTRSVVPYFSKTEIKHEKYKPDVAGYKNTTWKNLSHLASPDKTVFKKTAVNITIIIIIQIFKHKKEL